MSNTQQHLVVDSSVIVFLGFDMGGTSTDVSRVHKEFEHIFENVTAGVPIQVRSVKDFAAVPQGGERKADLNAQSVAAFSCFILCVGDSKCQRRGGVQEQNYVHGGHTRICILERRLDGPESAKLDELMVAFLAQCYKRIMSNRMEGRLL